MTHADALTWIVIAILVLCWWALDDIHKDLAAMRKDREKAEKEAMYGKDAKQ